MSTLQLSYTKLKTWQTCQRKFYWQYVRRIEPLARNVALDFGSAWHKAMSEWHTKRDLDLAIAAFELAFADEPSDTKRTQATAKKMLTLYSQRYANEVFKIVADERRFELQLGAITWTGQIDKLIDWDGKPFVLDHKTTTSLGSHMLKGFKPNLQIAGYVMAANRLYDPRYHNVLIDIAWVGKTEPTSGERFIRYPEAVEAWEEAEFEHFLQAEGLKIQLATKFDDYTPNWSACTQYGECPFRTLCMSPPAIREKLIETHYQPIKRRQDAPNGDN
jgi:RecB family exonuclease